MPLYQLCLGRVPLLKLTTEKGYPYSNLSTGGLVRKGQSQPLIAADIRLLNSLHGDHLVPGLSVTHMRSGRNVGLVVYDVLRDMGDSLVSPKLGER